MPRNSTILGQGLTEYLILLMLIAVISIPATRSLGNLIRDKLQQVRAELNSEVSQHSAPRKHRGEMFRAE